ncbi:MAG: UDP-glucose/GDP-mannose dehydrogenase family protein [Calditrichaeota bacterium]|nr:UDP-glucose/GDP-mannose dehydrogenase family protein [Calditrichota bacterium]MCB9474649.1 UDP-glucose/GDP-mannose dehydrogenase family protein [Candidatus Delongbacteria bacterium]
MKLTVVGTGYVGLVAGVCFAEVGNDVICVDVDAKKIQGLNEGRLPIYEPGLKEMLERVVANGRMSFSTDTASAVAKSEVVFIAVGTPPDEDGSADLKHVLDAAGEIARAMTHYTLVVDKSTVPVGTAEKVAAVIRENTSQPFDVVSNPEFLKEGAALGDFLKPDRVVIGADSERARTVMNTLYAPFVRTGHPVLTMSVKSAELTKYAANSLLATKISFMNEIARICDRVGANVDEVRRGIGSDSRIGGQFLFPGVGYGGSCFPKDVKAIIHTADSYDYDFQILKAVESVNALQKTLLVDVIRKHFNDRLDGLCFALWGLAFKPRTDDMREAPALEIINGLMAHGARFRCFDPEAMDNARQILGDRVEFCSSNYEALAGADALIVATEWADFRTPDFARIRESLSQPVVFDGRNIWRPDSMQELGFTYYSIGRPQVK